MHHNINFAFSYPFYVYKSSRVYYRQQNQMNKQTKQLYTFASEKGIRMKEGEILTKMHAKSWSHQNLSYDAWFALYKSCENSAVWIREYIVLFCFHFLLSFCHNICYIWQYYNSLHLWKHYTRENIKIQYLH